MGCKISRADAKAICAARSSPSSPQLPVEIIILIAEQCDSQSTLAALCLLDRRTSAAILPQLYRHVRIIGEHHILDSFLAALEPSGDSESRRTLFEIHAADIRTLEVVDLRYRLYHTRTIQRLANLLVIHASTLSNLRVLVWPYYRERQATRLVLRAFLAIPTL